jgi:hypothetical protein
VRLRSSLSLRRLVAAPFLGIALLSATLLGSVSSLGCNMHGFGTAHVGAGPAATRLVALDAETPQMTHGGGDPHDAHRGCDCTCVGDCTMVAPLVVPPAGVILRVALVEPQPQRPLDTEPPPSPSEPDRLLPFANGPPASALI